MYRACRKTFCLVLFCLLVLDWVNVAMAKNRTGTDQAFAEKVSRISQLRFWSYPHYTRMALYLSARATYAHDVNRSDCPAGASFCIDIRVKNSCLARNMAKTVVIADPYILKAILQQPRTNESRILVAIKRFKQYEVFTLPNPYRIVVDIWGYGSTRQPAEQQLRMSKQ